jgi:hypothetical protein
MLTVKELYNKFKIKKSYNNKDVYITLINFIEFVLKDVKGQFENSKNEIVLAEITIENFLINLIVENIFNDFNLKINKNKIFIRYDYKNISYDLIYDFRKEKLKYIIE